MDVRIVNLTINADGHNTAVLVVDSTGEILMISDIATLASYCKALDYTIVNNKEMIDSAVRILVKTLTTWPQYRRHKNS